MSDKENPLPKVPESRVVPKRRTRLSLVWIIPIVAAAAGVWVAVTRIMSQGPKITIVFQSAEGLDAHKTRILYKGLEIGTIAMLRLSDDHQHVIATAQMVPKSEAFLVRDTKFWVVRPRVSGLNISGLGTLISGNYIGVGLGQSRRVAREFMALESPPVVAADAPGRFFVLKTPAMGSLDNGTPLFFRQLQAGQVVSYEIDKNGQGMNVRVFVQAPYDQYVTPNTRFWQASGIDVSLNARGLRVRTESLMSILAGGVAFETPATEPVLPAAGADSVFRLFSDREEAFKPPVRNPHTYLLVFKQSSVRGLAPGAPVELGGVTIGEVADVHPEFDTKTSEFSVLVTVGVDPTRFGVRFLGLPDGQDAVADNKKAMDTLVARGLRAQLRTGNLLSGSLYVAVDFFPEQTPAAIDWSQNPVQLPTIPGQIEAIEISIANIMKKVEQMQFKEINDDVRKAVGDLDTTLVSVRGTITNADKLITNAGKLIEPNSVLVQGVDGTLDDVSRAARSLRVLADYLERHPEALVHGKAGEEK